MTSDMFPAKQRASALSWYAAGINIGSGMGLLVGGWIAQWFGWRTAFFFAGLPGVILALVVRFTIREPLRGAADGVAPSEATAPVGLIAGIKFMWSQPAFRHLAMAGGLASLVGNGVLAFLPTFLTRSFHASSGAVGTTVALLVAGVGGLGTLLSGRIVDHFSKHDIRAGLNVEALVYFVAAPALVVVFMQQSFASVLWTFLPSAFVYAFFMGPICSYVQALAPTRMRASASAFLFLIFAVLGNGVGPQLTGILSDVFRPALGAESLRYALMTLSLAYVWAAVHFLLARRTLKAGIARALAIN
jgi:MFS family permease